MLPEALLSPVEAEAAWAAANSPALQSVLQEEEESAELPTAASSLSRWAASRSWLPAALAVQVFQVALMVLASSEAPVLLAASTAQWRWAGSSRSN